MPANSTRDYDYYRNRLRGQEFPYACLDAEVLRANVETHLARARNKSIRLASKSIRSAPVMEMIMAMDDRFLGIMAYHGAEAIALHNCGFRDILLGYPVVDSSLIKRIGQAIKDGATITLMVDLKEHLDILAGLARLFSQDAFCRELRAATDSDTLYRLATGWEAADRTA